MCCDVEKFSGYFSFTFFGSLGPNGRALGRVGTKMVSPSQ